MKLMFVFFLFLSMNVYSQDSRWVDLEWDPVLEAREYEIELFQEEDEKILPRGKFKTDSSQWSHAVPPGKYFLRLRSMDKRGVPGEWSQNIPLKVRLPNPLLLRPAPADKISDPLVTFEWGPIPGATNYQLIVRNAKKDILYNSTTSDLKGSVYLDQLGEINWTAFALEKEEESKKPDEFIESAFKSFNRVGTILEAPKVGLNVNEKVIFNWEKVRAAQVYEIEYLPPPGSDKNRKFLLKQGPLAFPVTRLKDGTTTLTIKSTAEGYQDSNKSIVKISRSGSSIEVEDIIQGREIEEIKTVPTRTSFRNELFLGVSLAKFTYESENIDTDTRLNQKSLTGIGVFGEWNQRPTINSLNRKVELSFLNLSSGVDSGFANRAAYTLHKEIKTSKRTFTYGAGLSYLSLPSFLGDRFNNKIKVKSSSSVGPDLQIGLSQPLNNVWDIQGSLTAAYQPLFISSAAGGAKAYTWMRALIRIQRYYTEKQAFFGQFDYQTWDQKFSGASSKLSGMSLSFGLKTTF